MPAGTSNCNVLDVGREGREWSGHIVCVLNVEPFSCILIYYAELYPFIYAVVATFGRI